MHETLINVLDKKDWIVFNLIFLVDIFNWFMYLGWTVKSSPREVYLVTGVLYKYCLIKYNEKKLAYNLIIKFDWCEIEIWDKQPPRVWIVIESELKKLI